jgi:hypothetical protein
VRSLTDEVRESGRNDCDVECAEAIEGAAWHSCTWPTERIARGTLIPALTRLSLFRSVGKGPPLTCPDDDDFWVVSMVRISRESVQLVVRWIHFRNTFPWSRLSMSAGCKAESKRQLILRPCFSPNR